MNIKELLFEEKAVSPVIGVILMVAITVILAAVIGTFVLGIGQNQQTTPSASFDFEYDSDGNNVTITHTGGDTFSDENTGISSDCSNNGLQAVGNGSAACWNTPISAGSTFVVESLSGGEDVRLVWTAPGGGKTNTVGSFSVPS